MEVVRMTAVLIEGMAVGEVALPVGNAIEVRGVEKRYGPKEVLRGVDFDVRTGEVFCVLGPNGAGKTTILEILEGFREPTAGSVRVLGFDPKTEPLALRQRVGVVLQECGFPKYFRVREMLEAWRVYYPRPRPLDELLAVVELADEADTVARRLSGGQRRRLDFALALAGDPELIFLDEPTTGFDPEARRRCWTAIENLRALGKTIVLTTHYLDEAERLADRVAILACGRIGMSGSPRQLVREVGAPTEISFVAPAAVPRRAQAARLGTTGGPGRARGSRGGARPLGGRLPAPVRSPRRRSA
jgi:ABC-2 type transport system ATP-binding protein